MDEVQAKAIILQNVHNEVEELHRALDEIQGLDDQDLSRKKAKISEPEIHRRCAICVEVCCLRDFPPPLSLSHLVARCLNVKADPFIKKTDTRPIEATSQDAWFRAVQCEIDHSPTPGAPLAASVSAVARAAGVDRSTIRHWRREAHYIFDVDVMRLTVGRAIRKSEQTQLDALKHEKKKPRR